MPDNILKVAVHQPGFLPWAGFWHKAVSSDVMALYTGVQFDQHDFQHRVKLNGGWLTLPVEAGSGSKFIRDVKLSPEAPVAIKKIVETLRQTCLSRKNKHGHRLDGVVGTLSRWNRTWLSDLNIELIEKIGEVLGLRTRFIEAGQVWEGTATTKLNKCLSVATAGQACTYLSGASGRDYLELTELRHPHATWFQKVVEGTSPDTVLQLIASHDDPLSVIKACASWETHGGTALEKADTGYSASRG